MGSIVFVGMDVHKATIAVAVAEGVRGGEVRQLGIFPNRAEVIAKLAGRLAGDGRELSFCYEAGPCGYGLQRQLEGLGHASCMVVAPSLIPSKPGDRVKTDRRDALSLAKLHRAGELTAVCGAGRGARGDARPPSGPEPRPCGCSARRASTCRASCCGMAGSMPAGTTWTTAYRRLVDHTPLRASSAADRAAGLHPRHRGRGAAGGPTRRADHGPAPELVAGAGRSRPCRPCAGSARSWP